MLVNCGVVHQDHYLLGLRVPVDTELVQCSVEEVVENDGVGATLSNLG